MRRRAAKVNSAPYTLHHTTMNGQCYRFAAADDKILLALRLQILLQRKRLNVEIREKAAAEKDARIFKADAEKAERQALADAQLYEAQKIAEAIERKALAMQKYGQAAMLEMVVDKLPDIARAIGEPLSPTEKIILFGEGATTGLARDVTGSMMQTFEAMKSSVELDIPGLLKAVATGGLSNHTEVSRSIEADEENSPSGDTAE